MPQRLACLIAGLLLWAACANSGAPAVSVPMPNSVDVPEGRDAPFPGREVDIEAILASQEPQFVAFRERAAASGMSPEEIERRVSGIRNKVRLRLEQLANEPAASPLEILERGIQLGRESGISEKELEAYRMEFLPKIEAHERALEERKRR